MNIFNDWYKFFVAVVALSTQDNIKLVKSGFKSQLTGININQKQQYKHKTKSSFQVVNRLFILLFKINAHLTSCNQHFLPTIEVKYYNVVISGNEFWKLKLFKRMIT